MNDMTKFQELEWKINGDTLYQFQDSGAVAVGENIYITGGYYGLNHTGGLSAPLNKMLIYHPETQECRMTSDAPVSSLTKAVALYKEQEIYCASGYGICVFDIAAESWREDPIAYFEQENGNANIHIVGDKLYSIFTSGSQENFVQVYDIPSGRWSWGAAMPEKQAYGATVSVGSKIYIIGGQLSGIGYIDLVQIYDTETDSWSKGSNLPVKEMDPARCAFGPYIFVMGGTGNLGESVALVYDTRTDEWLRLADLTQKRWRASGVTWNGGIHCMGSHFGVTTEVERLDLTQVLDHFAISHRYEHQGGGQLRKGYSYYRFQGEGHKAAAPELNGYVCIGYRLDGGELVGETSLEIAKVTRDHTVTFVYKDEGKGFSVVEHYRLANGTPVRASTASYPDKGETYEKAAPQISGYSYTGHMVDGGEVSAGPAVRLENVQRDHTVVFLYEYTGVVEPEEFLVRERYWDEKAGEAIRSETSTAVERGEYYAKAAPQIEGYRRTGHRIDDGAATGTLTAVIDSVEREHLVTFLYQLSGDGNGGGDGNGDGNGGGSGGGSGCCGCSMPVNIHIENFHWGFDRLVVQQCNCSCARGENADR